MTHLNNLDLTKLMEQNFDKEINDTKWTNQTYFFLIKSLDEDFVSLFHWFNCCKHSSVQIIECLDHIIKTLEENEVHVIGLSADGGALCQSALKSWNKYRKINGRIYIVYCFSDYDHLCKTNT